VDIRRVASRFPLVPRPRPAGGRLADRVAALAATAENVADHNETDALATAARVHNQAALIVSDAGLHNFARRLCWEHADLYQHALPLDAPTARLALEPVVNLARLHIRRGNGITALDLLTTLHEAVIAAKPAVIDGHELHLDHLTATVDDRRTVARWLWTVRLADGVRALATAGHWDQAATHAQRCGGVGQRLLDGRQTVILAHLLSGHSQAAIDMINNSVVSEPWEQTVQSCLELLSRLTSSLPTRNAAEELIWRYHTVPDDPGLIVFRTRLGLTAVDLANAANHPGANQLAVTLADQAIQMADGYAAREVLTDYRYRLTSRQTTALESIVEASGIGTGTIPNTVKTQIETALEASRTVAMKILSGR
jgi:hypothetical protein